MQHVQVVVNIPGREEMRGLLYLSEDKKHWIEIPSRGFGYEDYFIPVIYATNEKSGELYSCIQCHIKKTEDGTATFHIVELILDEHSPEVTEPFYKGIQADINGLAYWSGSKRVNLSLSIEKLMKQELPEELFTYKICDEVELKLENYVTYKFDKQTTSFENKSRVAVFSSKPTNRLVLYNHLLDFLRIHSLFVDPMPGFSKIELVDMDGNLRELQRSDIKVRDDRWMISYVNFMHGIEPHFEKIVNNYYARATEWRRVFDLLNESRQNKTKEVSFLNITTALEILHRYFLAGDNMELMKEYNESLVEAGVVEKNPKAWVNVTRYYHLIERVMHLSYFTQAINKKFELCRLMRNTRNWYTHYDDGRGKIWTPAQLIPVNNLLSGVAKAVMLQLLGLPDELINKLVSAEAHMMYNNYEANPYSLSYREDSLPEGVETE